MLIGVCLSPARRTSQRLELLPSFLRQL